MTTRNDAQFDAMREAVPDSQQYNDLLLGWLQLHGAVSDSIPDAWRQFLDARDEPEGHVTDRLYRWLASIGFDESDHLTDRIYAWVASGMPVPGASS